MLTFATKRFWGIISLYTAVLLTIKGVYFLDDLSNVTNINKLQKTLSVEYGFHNRRVDICKALKL